MDRPLRLDPAVLETRPVERAGLLLLADALDGSERHVIVQDATTGAFVDVACTRQPLALSRDGRRLLHLSDPAAGGPDADLVVHVLADGAETRFGDAAAAALRPDGRTLAVLSTGLVVGDDDAVVADLVVVRLVDAVSGAERRLWSSPGFAPAECSVSWSPDSRYIAVQHLAADEQFAVTVLDAGSGRPVSRLTGRQALTSSQGSWYGDRELLVVPEYVDYEQTPVEPVLVRDVESGAERRIDRSPELPEGCWAFAGGRMIGRFPHDGIGTAGLDGGDPRLLLTHPPSVRVHVVDIAPGAAPLP